MVNVKKSCIVGLAVLLSFLFLGGSVAAAQYGTVTVIADQANLRAGPGTSFPIAGTVRAGQSLELITQEREWAKVRYAGKEAWIHTSLVEFRLDLQPTLAVVTASRANLRSGPSTSTSIVGRANRSQSFVAIAKRTGWVMIQTQGGGHAWIAEDLVKLQTLNEQWLKTSNVAREALALVDSSLRFSPADFSGVVTSVRAGSILKYEGSQQGWLLVRTASGKRGWIDANDVKLYNRVAFPQSVNYRLETDVWEIQQLPMRKAKSTCNLRSGPGTQYKVVGRLQGGTVVKVLSVSAGWLKVSTPNGNTAWVASYLTVPYSTPAIAKVRLEASTPHLKTLTVEGDLSRAVPFISPSGTGAGVFLSDGAGRDALLDVNAYDLTTLSLNRNGIWLGTKMWPKIELVERTPNRLVFRVSTDITGVTLSSRSDRDVLFIQARGYLSPTVEWNESRHAVSITAPGANYTGSTQSFKGRLATSVYVASSSNLNIDLRSTVGPRYIARQIPGGLQFELVGPGLAGKKILIDAGHGGPDPGAVGPTGLYEKDVNLQIAMRLKSVLEAMGAQVYMTRTSDSEMDLESRAAMAGNIQADCMVSVHNNANVDRSVRGTSVYLAKNTPNTSVSSVLARILADELSSKLGSENKGARLSNLYIPRESGVPCVIAEVLFISNPTEEALLRAPDTVQRAAEGLATGLQKFFQ
ncbi:MAG TPA: SH3 domain-containing protein [Firmicutes bacterium]|nr:SH3 domain-containing protein [Bacillota bacterium]